MSNPEKKNEEEVFLQSADDEELSGVAGGEDDSIEVGFCAGTWDADSKNCTKIHERSIYGGNGFPNCAASVEDGSWCRINDACFDPAIDYQGMEGCKKAWK